MSKTWFRLLVIVLALPLAGYPALLSGADDADPALSTLVWLYPAYVVCAAVCAWMCYPRRKDVAWILLALMLLTQIGMYYTCL